MVDNLTKEKRSKVMASIKGRNTKPEIIVRKLLWSNGHRYRIHNKKVFGIPDISNKNKKIAIFIDGCFWHGCSSCYKEPRTNVAYWRTKIMNNKKRRQEIIKKLRKDGWRILEFWEHRIIKEPETVTKEISRFF